MSDKFTQRLDEQRQLLVQCQNEKSLKSCLPCEDFFTCILRKNYTDAVYSSMNKGHGGDFDF